MIWQPVDSGVLRDRIAGNRAASVLPDPVGATIRTFFPERIPSTDDLCIGLSPGIPACAWSCSSEEENLDPRKGDFKPATEGVGGE